MFPPGSRAILERAELSGTMTAHLRLLRTEGGYLVLGNPNPPGSALLDQGSRAIARIDTGATTFVMHVTVAGRTTDGNYLVSMSELVERFPKRRYFRTAVDLRAMVGGVACHIIDLSGCGLLAEVPATLQLKSGDILPAFLDLPGQRVELMLCAVRLGQNPSGLHEIGFDFVAPADNVQDAIIAYVLQQHRRKLRWLR